MTRRIRTGVALAAVSAMVPAGQAAAAQSSATDRVLTAAAKQGVDARPLLNRTIQFNGARMTVGQFISTTSAQSTQRSGPAGTPEVQAGDVVHAAFSYGPGVGPIYSSVTQSQVAPSTPLVPVPVPATPATDGSMFVHFGGPLTQIKGSGWAEGYHVVGGPLTNASTETSGPDGFWLSGRSTGVITDSGVDFTGTVGAVVNHHSCLFGFCLAVGGFAGDGVAVWDAAPLLPGTPRPETPALP